MGQELGPAFALLSRQLVELHFVWQQYRQLYADTPDTVDLLNRTAGLFFRIVQGQLWDSVLLGICRITDPAKQGKNKNLTVWSLHDLITDAGLQVEVHKCCQAAYDASELARSHRNKRIAHQDHDYRMNPTANPLSTVTRDAIEEMLKALRTGMNRIENHYMSSITCYEEVGGLSGAGTLVSKLRKLERLTNSRDTPDIG